jgi:hypothetical protein
MSKIDAKHNGLTSQDVFDSPTVPLAVPMHDNLTPGENICCGMRQELISLGEHDGVMTGVGSDCLILNFRGRSAMIRGVDMFIAWVATFDPEMAEKIKEANA